MTGQQEKTHVHSKRDLTGNKTQPDVQSIVRQEEEALTRQSVADAWNEVRRRHAEVLIELDQALQTLKTRREESEDMLRTLSHRREAIQALVIDRNDIPPLTEVRQMKQDLHDAHVELTVFQRMQHQSADRWPDRWVDLSFAELSRIGLALLWPLIAGLLIAVLMLIVGLRLALTL